MKKIELLAPAGSYNSLKAAVNAGCDAVYLGGTMFGARAYADNFDLESLKCAIDYVHLRGKRLYLTVNTLLKTGELEQELYDYLIPFYQQGLDAVIVQDLGVVRFLSSYMKELPIHASTQMSLMMAEGAALLLPYQVKRLVPGRELSLDEIKRLKAGTSMEVETFIHGALCYSYSGQCLMSSMIGGRSGNRGRCAQPCRKPYRLIKQGRRSEEAYFLSPKDLCMLHRLSELSEAGIDSLKIEGRMKRAEYVAGVTAAYRRQLDILEQYGILEWEKRKKTQPLIFQNEVNQLKELYHRGGFCEGYYQRQNGMEMMSMRRPNHEGVFVGKVKEVQKDTIIISLEIPVQDQDVLEIRGEARSINFKVKTPQKREIRLKNNRAEHIKKGAEVYRTRNEALLNTLSELYISNNIKISLSGKAEAEYQGVFCLTLTSEEGHTVSASFGPVEKAVSKPSDRAEVVKRIKKTGDTHFVIDPLELTLEDNLFLSVSSLNEVRRKALSDMEQKILSSYHRAAKKRPDFAAGQAQKQKPTAEQFGYSVQISSLDQVTAVCSFSEVSEVICPVDTPLYSEIESICKQIKKAGWKTGFFYSSDTGLCI